jgi:hypothetical protein
MCSGAYRKQGTCAAAYQPRISTVDGQATFFERDRQNTQIHELFRRCSLRRDYNYRPDVAGSSTAAAGRAGAGHGGPENGFVN